MGKSNSAPSRRAFLKTGALVGVAAALHPGVLSAYPRTSVPGVRFIWSGGVTRDTAVVKAQLDRDATVQLALSQDQNFGSALFSESQTAAAANNRIVRFEFKGLVPDTEYFFAIAEDGALDQDKPGCFRTFPPVPGSFSIAFSSCARTGSNHEIFDTIRRRKPLFFLHAGDLHYENIAANDRNRFRQAYDAALAAPRQNELYRNIPLVYMWDDHDFGPNNSDGESPSKEASRLTYQEYVPHYPLVAGTGNVPIYQAFSAGRVRFILSDLRSMRTPPNQPDGPSKTMMGAAQKAWFKQELLDAQGKYPVIVWVTTMPWIEDQANPNIFVDDGWHAYATERRELANFIKDNNIQGLLALSGDAHMLAIDDGSNSDYADGGGAGFPVFHAAPLDREARVKGGPYSEGTVIASEHQFGVVTFEDDGLSRIDVTFSGRNQADQELMHYERTYPAWSTVANEPGTDLPARLHLLETYPNPFSTAAVIRYGLPTALPVRLSVYDLQGRLIKRLVEARQAAGTHEVPFEARGLPAGTYVCRLEAGTQLLSRPLTVVR